MRLVLDASAAVRLVMRADHAVRLLDQLSGATLVAAPGIYTSEVANALWKYVSAGTLETELALERYQEALELVDDVTPDQELATEALTEAVRYQHPVYDLLYAVLARRTGCAVLTMDQRLMTLLDRMGMGTHYDNRDQSS